METAINEGTSGHVAVREATRGGVVNLLRMAKLHCGAAVAFAALGTPDQPFSLASYPDAGGPGTAEAPAWGPEVLTALARAAWATKELGRGEPVVCEWRRPGAAVPGPLEARVAAVALRDETDPDHPWGLLGVAREEAPFDAAQLVILGGLAHRLTAYLRARQQVIDPAPARPDRLASAPEGADELVAHVGAALRAGGAATVAVVVFALCPDDAPRAAGLCEELRHHLRRGDVVAPLGTTLGVALALTEEPGAPSVRDRLLGVLGHAGATVAASAIALAAAGEDPEALVARALGGLSPG